MTVVTRFAPSPTGFLHIGSARTALFNWLYAKHAGGKFLLRVEDTDKERSTEEARQAILSGLQWLGITWDDEVVYQSERQVRHVEIVEQLINAGKAYRCYCSVEELDAMRARAKEEKRSFQYDGTWRDRDESEAPEGVAPVIRLKAPREGSVTINDAIQGEVTVAHSQLDDMVLLRADGSPTYMLAVVVDDHDMGVTQVIRGDDHFTNSFRQSLIYSALGWALPDYAHIPLIHGADGAKLSKRHGALGVEAYREMGYLPEALCNYLLRLGWSHGDDEIITQEDAVRWFDLAQVGKAPSRFDLQKLSHLNAHYLRQRTPESLIELLEEQHGSSFDTMIKARLSLGMEGLVQRSKTMIELSELAAIYIAAPTTYTEKAKQQLSAHSQWLNDIRLELEAVSNWSASSLEDAMRQLTDRLETKLGKVMGVIRAAVTGVDVSPSMFEVMEALGKGEVLCRFDAAIAMDC